MSGGDTWGEFLHGPVCGHAVQIYADVSELAQSVAAYVAAGFASGEPAVLLATPDTLAAFAKALAELGWDTAQLDDEGLLVTADAAATLRAIMGVTGIPSAGLFEAVVGGLLDGAAERFPGKRVRAFGELVDLLSGRGQADAALAVEERWNELGRSRRFLSLLCGYRLDVFDRGVQAGLLVDICRTHTHVLPAADPARLERAVDAALEEVLGRDSAGKVYVLVGREIRESRVPAAQLVLMWVSENVPALAERILAAAREGYAAVPAPDSAPS